jgi:hypothetical protein
MGYNTLYSNTCEGANQNPFDPTNWTVQSLQPLQILSAQLVDAVLQFGEEYYSGSENLTADCFIQYQIASIVPPSGSTNSTLFSTVRSIGGSGYSSGYWMLVWQADETALLYVFNPSESAIINKTLSKLSVGDTFLLSAVGSTISAYQNGTLVASVTDSTTDRDGTCYVGVNCTATQSDTGIVNLAIGSVTSTSSISGNAGVAGALVSYSGTASGSVAAGAGGAYTIPSLANGSYTITPSLAGYTFSPTSQNETVSGNNITGVNFTATKSGAGPSAVLSPAYGPRPVQIFGQISSGANVGEIAAVAVDANGNLAISGGSGGSVNTVDILGSIADAIPCMIYGAYTGSTSPGSAALVAVAVDNYGNILASIGTGGGNTGTTIDTPTACDTGVTPVQVFGRDPAGTIVGVPASSAGALGDTINPITNVPITATDERTTENQLPIPILLCGRIAPGYANAGAIVAVALDSTGALCISGSSGSSTTPSQVQTFDNGECALVQLYGRNSSGQLVSVPLTGAGSLLLN